jgi:hypothetical protein
MSAPDGAFGQRFLSPYYCSGRDATNEIPGSQFPSYIHAKYGGVVPRYLLWRSFHWTC